MHTHAIMHDALVVSRGFLGSIPSCIGKGQIAGICLCPTPHIHLFAIRVTEQTIKVLRRLSQGFFYGRSLLSSPTLFPEASRPWGLWYHALGTNQSQDIFLLDFPAYPTWDATLNYTDDNKYGAIQSSLQLDMVPRLLLESAVQRDAASYAWCR